MAASQVTTELVPKYVRLLARIAEFLVVGAVVAGAWAAGIDLSTTSQHSISGDLTVEGTDEV